MGGGVSSDGDERWDSDAPAITHSNLLAPPLHSDVGRVALIRDRVMFVRPFAE